MTFPDPFWDISLDLGEVKENARVPTSLTDCLDRFTRPEHLGSGSKIKCSNCNAYQESTKQLSMHTLPIVASFHLKRFEHHGQSDKKISAFISFPLNLDMKPFMSKPNNALGDYVYSLYAVINHVGSINKGHFTAFVRHCKEVWVKCDDQTITKVPMDEVLNSEA